MINGFIFRIVPDRNHLHGTDDLEVRRIQAGLAQEDQDRYKLQGGESS